MGLSRRIEPGIKMCVGIILISFCSYYGITEENIISKIIFLFAMWIIIFIFFEWKPRVTYEWNEELPPFSPRRAYAT